MKQPRISDEDLKSAVEESNSVSESMRRLGKSPNGSMHGYFSRRIRQLGISTEHFDRSLAYNPSWVRRTPDKVLVRVTLGVRTPGAHLKKALLEVGVPYRCSVAECLIVDEWLGKPISLQVDHIDGDRFNNLEENLRFLCPMCHAQTETYGFRGDQEKAQLRQCITCGIPISLGSKRGFCKKHWPRVAGSKKTKITWPENEVLAAMIRKTNRNQVSKQLGVSETAVRKRLKSRNIEVQSPVV